MTGAKGTRRHQWFLKKWSSSYIVEANNARVEMLFHSTGPKKKALAHISQFGKRIERGAHNYYAHAACIMLHVALLRNARWRVFSVSLNLYYSLVY